MIPLSLRETIFEATAASVGVIYEWRPRLSRSGYPTERKRRETSCSLSIESERQRERYRARYVLYLR
jgi:hypothetical protein